MTLNLPRLDITSDGPPSTTKLYLDGRPVRGVRSWKLEQSIGDPIPKLTLEILVSEVSAKSGDVQVAAEPVAPTVVRRETIEYRINPGDVSLALGRDDIDEKNDGC